MGSPLDERAGSHRACPLERGIDLNTVARCGRAFYPRELGSELRAIVGRFREVLEPLRAARRLGVVLLQQYPVWFTLPLSARPLP
jgi:hypothetical protein